jgi:enoyl-CoA hydratase
MSYQNILTKNENGVFTITINRETKLNALNIQTLQEIRTAVTSVQNDKEVYGIILTGAGSKAFAAGADIAEFANFTVAQGNEMSADGHAVMNAIEHSKKPVVAAVNGFALGGGCELAMACHIRVASDNARFGQPEVNLGLVPGYAGTQRLVQLIGKGKALELLMTGDAINAHEAKSLGLVNHVVEQAELINKCNEIIDKIKTKAPLAIASVISLVNTHFDKQNDGFAAEITDFGNFFGTKDFKEGVDAFLNKRKATFTGE